MLSCSLGWPQTQYVAEDSFELLIFLLSPPKPWHYRYVPCDSQGSLEKQQRSFCMCGICESGLQAVVPRGQHCLSPTQSPGMQGLFTLPPRGWTSRLVLGTRRNLKKQAVMSVKERPASREREADRRQELPSCPSSVQAATEGMAQI